MPLPILISNDFNCATFPHCVFLQILCQLSQRRDSMPLPTLTPAMIFLKTLV